MLVELAVVAVLLLLVPPLVGVLVAELAVAAVVGLASVVAAARVAPALPGVGPSVSDRLPSTSAIPAATGRPASLAPTPVSLCRGAGRSGDPAEIVAGGWRAVKQVVPGPGPGDGPADGSHRMELHHRARTGHPARHSVRGPGGVGRVRRPTIGLLPDRATMCDMRQVTHREMRNQSGEILRLVAEGETIQVTNRGQLAALIVPPPSDVLTELAARGQVRRARRPPSALAGIVRRKPRTTSEAILADVRGCR